MNTNTSNPAFEDLARLRDIAEEGRRLPLAGGRYLILWGYTIFAAIVAQAVITLHWLPVPPMSIALTWPVIMVTGGLIARHPAFSRAAQKARPDLGARIERTVWTFGGAFLALAPLSAVAAAMLETSGSAQLFALMMGMPALTFGVYAIALAASAEIAAFPRLKRYALLSLLFVPITLMLAGTLWQFAAVALGIVLVSIVPGHMMLTAERTTPHA
jgi:hypothetical protein